MARASPRVHDDIFVRLADGELEPLPHLLRTSRYGPPELQGKGRMENKLGHHPSAPRQATYKLGNRGAFAAARNDVNATAAIAGGPYPAKHDVSATSALVGSASTGSTGRRASEETPNASKLRELERYLQDLGAKVQRKRSNVRAEHEAQADSVRRLNALDLAVPAKSKLGVSMS
eukprot:TRINITY_DN6074_c0_g1_i1.p2 TRINITY_DN6074_c0_g1~~TRINITY_DN6074_c0_g1_i1.p2  ORF type:complete len:175 (+),score=36.64 TRINITY_DN6074_c0_g1_i1:107-631(+)